MLSGKLAIERADNGWILSWYEKRKSATVTVDECREVYEDAGEFLARVAQVVGAQVYESAGTLAHSEQLHGSANPAVDPDVADLMPDGAPQSAYAE